MKKRIISIVLAVTMILSLLPATALAAEGNPPAETLTPADVSPAVEVCTEAELRSAIAHEGWNVKLTADFDICDQLLFEYSGRLDGNDHTITLTGPAQNDYVLTYDDQVTVDISNLILTAQAGVSYYNLINNNAWNTMTLTNCLITGGPEDGVSNNGNMTLTDCTISNNKGEGVYCNAPTTLVRCLVTGNGMGVRGSAYLQNSIVTGNVATNNYPGGFWTSSDFGNFSVTNSILLGNYSVLTEGLAAYDLSCEGSEGEIAADSVVGASRKWSYTGPSPLQTPGLALDSNVNNGTALNTVFANLTTETVNGQTVSVPVVDDAQRGAAAVAVTDEWAAKLAGQPKAILWVKGYNGPFINDGRPPEYGVTVVSSLPYTAYFSDSGPLTAENYLGKGETDQHFLVQNVVGQKTLYYYIVREGYPDVAGSAEIVVTKGTQSLIADQYTFNAENETLSTEWTRLECSVDGGITWTGIVGGNPVAGRTNISGATAEQDILVRYKEDDTSYASEAIVVPVEQQEKPTGVTVAQPTAADETGTLSGVTDQMEYSADEGATWTVGDGNAIANVPQGTTYLVRTKAVDNALPSDPIAVTVDIVGASAATTPTAAIDYENEALTGLSDGVLVDGTPYTVDGTLPIRESWYGKTVAIIQRGDGSTTNNSEAQNLEIAARPAAPTVTATDETYPGAGNGKLGTEDTMEYRLDGTADWISCTGEAADLAAGTYFVRLKATASAFAGVSAKAVVGSTSAQQETTPTASVSTDNTALESLAANGVYAINGTTYTADGDGKIPMSRSWHGMTLQIVKKGNGTTTVNSEAQYLTAPYVATYCVTYDINGGTGIVADNARYAEGDTVPVRFATIPQKTGYNFLGWATTPDAEAPIYTADGTTTFVMGAENVTLYAMWGTLAITYLDASGTQQTCYSVTEITDTSTAWSEGWYVVNGEVNISSLVTVTGNVHLILADGCHLTTTNGINVADDDNDPTTPSPNSLTIYAQSTGENMGKLTASVPSGTDIHHYQYQSAIGGGQDQDGGTITINGGCINASSDLDDGNLIHYTNSAAIGGGSYGNSGTITINGGVVTAKGHQSAIGGGFRGKGGSVTINGGTVTAESVSGSAIGAGGQSDNGGTITITGGNVTAIGLDSGLGGCSITISGGTVQAQGDRAPGIGGQGSTITITDGQVEASSDLWGAGIGGSECKITISGGTVTATGSNNAAGIGSYSGQSVHSITITGGTVTATGGEGAAGIGGGTVMYHPADEPHPGIPEETLGGSGGTITISGGTVTAIGGAASVPSEYDGSYYTAAPGIGDGGSHVYEGMVHTAPTLGSFGTGMNGNAFILATGGDEAVPALSDTDGKTGWNGIVVENKEGQVYGDVSLGENIEIPADVTLTIPAGATLTVPDGVTLTNNGTLNVYGSLDAQGAVDGDGAINRMSGSGTEADPYLITNAAELKAFADIVNSGEATACAKLTADIDLAGGPDNQWTPIGNTFSASFTGTFDGQGHTVSGLYFDDPGVKYAGLFGCMKEGGTIQNLTVENAHVSGLESVGGVCGENYGSIRNCRFSGSVTGTKQYVGGICGFNMGTISGCYNTGTVTGGDRVGGVCGTNGKNTSQITNCYNTGAMSGDTNVGGVCGYIEDGVLADCFNTGAVSGNSGLGGVCGMQVGSGAIQNCYYDSEKCSANDTKNGVTAKPTAAFESGEVAGLLRGEDPDSPWGQAIGSDGLPVLLPTLPEAEQEGRQVYTVTFMNGAAVYAKACANPGGTVELPDEPTQRECDFEKWVVGTEDVEFTSSTLVNADMTVSAQWTERKTVEIIPGDTVTLPGDAGIVTGNADGTVTITDSEGTQTTVTPPADGGKVTVNTEAGEITVPGGSTVQTGENGETVTLPDGGEVEPGGAVSGGSVQVGDTTVTVTQPQGGAVTVDPDGTVTIPGGSTAEIDQDGDGAADATVTVPSGEAPGTVTPGTSEVNLPADSTVTIPGGEGQPDTTITIGDQGGTVKPNDEGGVDVPEGSTVTTGDTSITIGPGNGGTVKPGGEVTVPENGKVTVNDGEGNTTIITPPTGQPVTPGENGTVTVPGGSTVQTGDGPVITVGDQGGSVNEEGGVTVPGGGTVTVPDGNGGTTTITVPAGGGTVAPGENGAVTVPGGSTVKPADGDPITVPETGGVVTPDGKVKYAITFDAQGGSTVVSQTVTAGEKVTKPTDPTRTGFDFDGWYTEAACTTPWNFDTSVTASMTLYAKWTAQTSSGSSSSGGSSSRKPSVSIGGNGEGGKVTASRDGSVTITPDEGYEIVKITVNGKEVEIPEDGKLTGLKRTDKVVVTFGEIPVSVPVSQRFTDVKSGAWYEDAVQYAVDNGLFNGMSETTFGPDVTMSRGMLATVLYRLAQKPEITTEKLFQDVSGGQYYTEAVKWAAEKGVVTGYGNGIFGPNDPITREQLATMLWRYAGSPNSTGSLGSFTDGVKTSEYAVPALQWAVEQGIVNGKGGGILDPKGNATRAEVAAMLMRYCTKTQI